MMFKTSTFVKKSNEDDKQNKGTYVGSNAILL